MKIVTKIIVSLALISFLLLFTSCKETLEIQIYSDTLITIYKNAQKVTTTILRNATNSEFDKENFSKQLTIAQEKLESLYKNLKKIKKLKDDKWLYTSIEDILKTYLKILKKDIEQITKITNEEKISEIIDSAQNLLIEEEEKVEQAIDSLKNHIQNKL